MEHVTATILLLEDDLDLGKELEDWFTFEGHTVHRASNTLEASHQLQCNSYDILIVDWILPGVSGLEFVRQFRSSNTGTPVIMLTCKSELDDKTQALDTGVDHYVVKPVEPKELSSRIQALIRKLVLIARPPFEFGDLTIDEDSHVIRCGGEELKLTPREFDCLTFLLKHREESPFPVEMMLKRVWLRQQRRTPAAVHNCISQLRRKLSLSGSKVGIGYQLGSGYYTVIN